MKLRTNTPLLLAALFALGALNPARGAEPAPPAEKLFAVTFTVGPAWDASKPFAAQAHSREHSANLMRLRAEGLALLGGRYSDKGLLIVRAASETAVRAELAKDPSIAAGTFQATVEEYRPFFHGDTKPPAASAEMAVIRAALAAYNAHDAAAVAAHYADDIAWFGFGADGKQSLEGDGRDAVQKWLAGYFQSLPDVRAEISDVAQSGAHVSFRERVTWTAKDGTKRAQAALAVYEVRDGKIKRAWYFPATRETPPAAK